MANYLNWTGLQTLVNNLKNYFQAKLSIDSSGSATKFLNEQGNFVDQVNADWNSNSGASKILNKPNIPSASTSNPEMDGTASPGSASTWSKSDHVHPSDTSREAVANKDTSISNSPTSGHYPTTEAVKNFVNSSIATNTANFLGSFTLTDLSLTYPATDVQIAAALNSNTWPTGVTPTNNDYVYVEIQDPQTTGIDDKVERFKFSDMLESWGYEYTLNNSSFTAAEMATLESGITASDKTTWNNHVGNTSNPHSVTKAQVGLGNVDNTADADKPVSTAQQTALNAKEDTSNKVTSWSSTVNDTHYPSEKLVKDSIDAIQSSYQDIGGRNLLSNVVFRGLNHFTRVNNTESYNGAAFTYDGVDADSYFMVGFQENVETGETVTFSFDLSGLNESGNEYISFTLNQLTGGTEYTASKNGHISFVITRTSTEAITPGTTTLTIDDSYRFASTAPSGFTISNVKLERGAVSTSYTKHPAEDPTGVYYVVGSSEYTAYSASSTYTAATSSGPFTESNSCTYGGIAYFCTTTISTPEAWTPSHWTAMDTPVLTGNIDGLTALYAGLKIAYKMSIRGGTSSTYLNINNLGNKYIKRNDDNLSTHLPANTVVFLAYDGTYWRWADAPNNYYTKTETDLLLEAKQDALTAQTAYSAKGSATKVPQITTNDLGQVTGITEVTISGVTPASHTHGNIQNGGTLQTSDVTIASGDKLVITDSSDSNKVARTSATFDGSTTTKALTPKGTFETFLQSHQDISGKEDKSNKVTSWQSTPSDTKYPSENLVKTSLDGKANDSDVVHKTGTETVSGVKTFSNESSVFSGKCARDINGEPLSSEFGSFRVELGNPTMEERAIIEETFANQLECIPKANVIYETSPKGTETWTTLTVPDSEHNLLWGGNVRGNIRISKNVDFRITINAPDYYYLNFLYFYASGTGATFHIKLEKKLNSSGAWSVVSDTATASLGWPAHNTIRHSNIAFSSYPSQYGSLRLTFYMVSTGDVESYPEYSIYKFRYYGSYPYKSDPWIVKNGSTGVTSFPKGITSGVAIPVSSGGTGKTSVKGAANAILGGMTGETNDIDDTNDVVFKYVSPSDSNGVLYYRKATKIWDYIKSKIGIASSSGSATKFLNEQGNFVDQVNADWNSNSGASQILNKPNIPSASTSNPVMDGTASPGSASTWSKSDHVHPSDTSREAVANKDTSIPNSPTSGHYPTTEAVKNFVNSSIATNTAYFLGTYDVENDLGLTTSATNDQIAAALNSYTFPSGVTVSNNDYVFVSINLSTTTAVDEYRRFKYADGTPSGSWSYEYTLNNSSFTQDQWDAINSDVTDKKVAAYDAHLTNTNNPHSVTAAQIGAQSALPTTGTATDTYAINISGNAATATTASSASSVAWADVSGKPSAIVQGVKLNNSSAYTPDANGNVNLPAATTSAYGVVTFTTIELEAIS